MARRRTPIQAGIETQILYVRHMPVKLGDRVRVEAARRGRACTMEWVAIRAIQIGLPLLEKEQLAKAKAPV